LVGAYGGSGKVAANIDLAVDKSDSPMLFTAETLKE